jgi:hypothetical protein
MDANKPHGRDVEELIALLLTRDLILRAVRDYDERDPVVERLKCALDQQRAELVDELIVLLRGGALALGVTSSVEAVLSSADRFVGRLRRRGRSS